MNYRLLVIDIDGTLHTSSREVPHQIPQYLRELETRGVVVMLCTGRRYRTALPIYRSLSLRGPMGLHSGALVMDPSRGERLYTCYIDEKNSQAICTIIVEAGLQPLIWEDNYPDSPDIIATENCTGFTAEYISRHSDFVRHMQDTREFSSEKILEVGAWGKFDELLAAKRSLEERLDGKARIHVAKNIIDDHCILEGLSPSAGKWNAVRHLAKTRGIEREEIVGIGDNYNDIDLVTEAGYGVAMGNAVEELKAVADHITSDNDEHGLYSVLQELFEER